MDIKTLRKVGHISQLGGIKRITLGDGPAKGVEAYEVYNAMGLRGLLLADLCLDLYEFSYKGINFAFHSKGGIISPAGYDGGSDFASFFRAGMLYTCGLLNTGPGCDDEGVFHCDHGKIGMTPASSLSATEDWSRDNPVFTVSGRIREAGVTMHNMLLHRQVETGLYDKEIRIKDMVENLEPFPVEHMILYHINIGYPLLDIGGKLYVNSEKTLPRTTETKEAVDSCLDVSEPLDHKHEDCFFHFPKLDPSGIARAAFVNHELQLGLYVEYSGDTLPILVQWKNMCPHDYVVAIEPSNSYIMGRSKERENGTLPKIEPYRKVEYRVTLGVLDGSDEIDAYLERHF